MEATLRNILTYRLDRRSAAAIALTSLLLAAAPANGGVIEDFEHCVVLRSNSLSIIALVDEIRGLGLSDDFMATMIEVGFTASCVQARLVTEALADGKPAPVFDSDYYREARKQCYERYFEP